MSISKKKGSPYYYTRFSIGGIRVQESTKATTRSEAQRYEEKRRADIRDQVLLGKKPVKTWADAEFRYLDEMRSKKSICDDIWIFEWLQNKLSHMKLEDISKDLIENIARQRESENVAPSTVNKVLGLIKAVLNRACKNWEWINKVPYIQMRKINNSRVRWLTKAEATRLLSELPPHLNAMARFTLATGLRASNVFNLEWKDIDIEREHLVIHPDQNKTGRYLGIPLNKDAVSVLKEQIGKSSKFVFTFKGNPISQCSTRAWRNALKRADIEDFRWHDLRHTWASWHVQNGTSLQELCEMGGWSSMEMVLRYAHLSSNQLRIAADRLADGEKLVKSNLKLVGNDG